MTSVEDQALFVSVATLDKCGKTILECGVTKQTLTYLRISVLFALCHESVCRSIYLFHPSNQFRSQRPTDVIRLSDCSLQKDISVRKGLPMCPV
jgi:hypothetical protein